MKFLQGSYPGWLLDGNRLQVTGWTDMSFTASSDAHEQLPMGFNYKANQFLLQVNWLRFERPVDPNATTPTFGFRSDTILPGSDYRFLVERGLFSGQLTANKGMPNTYGIDPIQFYAEAYFPQVGRGLDVKVGRFFAQDGAESNAAIENPLGSRTYCYIYDPFTHTGVVTTLKLTNAWSVQNGLVLGSDVFIDPAARPTYVGSVKWAPPTGRDSAIFAVIVGPGRFEPGRNFNNPEVFDLVYTHKFNDRLSYTLDALFGLQTNVPRPRYRHLVQHRPLPHLRAGAPPERHHAPGALRRRPGPAYRLQGAVHRAEHGGDVQAGALAEPAAGSPLRLQRRVAPVRGPARPVHGDHGRAAPLVGPAGRAVAGRGW
jgi:hypothetical protein